MTTISEEISRILLKKLREEELDLQEAATLSEWESLSPKNTMFIAQLADEQAVSEKIKSLLQLDDQEAWKKIENELRDEWRVRKPWVGLTHWIRYAAAACIVLLFAAIGYYFFIYHSDIGPGGSKATLTLGEGSVVELTRAKNGTIASQPGVEIKKVADGQLEYQREIINASEGLQYNVLTTPRGGEYQVTLPDGTRVRLNAASAIRFPTTFAANERKVEIQGEAYFEVTGDPSRKFLVVIKSTRDVSRGEIAVTGTRFNIKAYDEEKNITATLLEGTVSVAAYSLPVGQETGGGRVKLSNPGQQAQITENNKIIIVDHVDASQVVSWKDGVEKFNNANVITVMQYISRWYDVEVIYAGTPAGAINGSIDRKATLSVILKTLESFGWRFKVEGRKITVMP